MINTHNVLYQIYVLYTRFFHLAFDVHLFIATYSKRTGNICLVWTRLSIWATHRAFGGGNCALIKGARLRRFGDHHRRAATNNHCTICAIAWTSRTHIDSVLMAAIDIIYICERAHEYAIAVREHARRVGRSHISAYTRMCIWLVIFFRSQLKWFQWIFELNIRKQREWLMCDAQNLYMDLKRIIGSWEVPSFLGRDSKNKCANRSGEIAS